MFLLSRQQEVARQITGAAANPLRIVGLFRWRRMTKTRNFDTGTILIIALTLVLFGPRPVCEGVYSRDLAGGGRVPDLGETYYDIV